MGSDDFTEASYETLKKQIIVTNFFKNGEKGILPKFFYKVSITLPPKPGKDITGNKKLQTNHTHEHRCEIP